VPMVPSGAVIFSVGMGAASCPRVVSAQPRAARTGESGHCSRTQSVSPDPGCAQAAGHPSQFLRNRRSTRAAALGAHDPAMRRAAAQAARQELRREAGQGSAPGIQGPRRDEDATSVAQRCNAVARAPTPSLARPMPSRIPVRGFARNPRIGPGGRSPHARDHERRASCSSRSCWVSPAWPSC
jgi:hypothetical protein